MSTANSCPSQSANLPSRLEPRLQINIGGYVAEGADVYIRWITAKQALDHPCLDSIPTDWKPLRFSTTISELKDIAMKRVYMVSDSMEETPPPNATVELFLLNCHLAGGDDITLGDLEVKTKPEDPLNVFVVLKSTRSTTAERPQDAWGFDSSDRGIATFQTSLKMLLREIRDGRADLKNVLEVLWEVTHFPPALIAFQQLNDTARHLDSRLPSLPLAVFAACFRIASARMIPPWIATSPTAILESSRQVFSWFHSLHSKSSKALGSHQELVHRVQLRESAQAGSSAEMPGRFDYNEDVIVQHLDATGALPGKPKRRIILVSKERGDDVSARTLAVALSGSFEPAWNYYFDLPLTVGRPLEHQRVDVLHPADFDNLLMTTNQDDAFRIIGPTKLKDSTPPFVTLDREGYVSVYSTKDIECEDKYPYTWNAINGVEILKGVEPSQFLLQKITPVIAQRKKEGTWEVDAWDEDAVITDSRTPEEAIVICFDQSSSMETKMGPGWVEKPVTTSSEPSGELSRLSEVKEVFQQLVARIAAYSLPTHLGLVTFSSQSDVRIQQALTPVLYDFKDRVMDIRPCGATALWDAIVKAKDMLVTFKNKHPNATRRIIVLTDGENNDSRNGAPQACVDLYNNRIVLDAIVIGTISTFDLFKMAKHTGGYAFSPKTRTVLFQIPLLETFIDIKTRPDIVRESVTLKRYPSSKPKHPDMEDPLDFPPCRPHRSQNDHFIALRDASRYLSALSMRSSRVGSIVHSSSASTFSGTSWGGSTINTGATPTSGASGSGRMFLSEIKAMIDNQHEFMDVYVSERNMGFWKVVMQGPPESPYEKGTFVLYIELGDGFPRKPPEVRFVTPILHPNITKVCSHFLPRKDARVADAGVQ
jgi:Ubiquitin-conjugating enzyme/von Willebrand factor type A domain